MPAPSYPNWVSPVRKEAEDRNKGLNVGVFPGAIWGQGWGEDARINLFAQLG